MGRRRKKPEPIQSKTAADAVARIVACACEFRDWDVHGLNNVRGLLERMDEAVDDYRRLLREEGKVPDATT
ncbi:MAG TPA: hypothetical protein VKS79_21320 [Gemmataceae bacterium]|nr:hypothetical protein [Gemmataceae bacterium]